MLCTTPAVIPDEIWVHIHDYSHGPALTHVCRYIWKLLGHRRRILLMVGFDNGPHRLATLPQNIEQLIVPTLDDAAMEYLQYFHAPFPSLVMSPGCIFPQNVPCMVHLIHDKLQPGTNPPVHLTDRGLMGIRQLVLRSPNLQHLHLALVMEAGPLVVAPWQLLLAALPETIVSLTIVCFVINHRHFVPLAWSLPPRGWQSSGL